MAQPQRFDRQNLLARKDDGQTNRQIARTYGVTESAIRSALALLDPAERARLNERSRQWQAAYYRRPCLAGCGRLAWHGPVKHSGLCRNCSAARRATSVRPDELQCGECRQWKPDDQFPHRHRGVARRGRHSVCRPCQTIARRRTRAAAKRNTEGD